MAKSKHLNSAWLNTQDTALSLGISPRHLLNLKDKLLKMGKHYRDIRRPGAARATYRWHLKSCQALLELPPEKRGS